MNLIYTITNTVNDKVYVGLTTGSLHRRKGEHISRFNLGDRSHRLYEAMRKHGIEAFRFDECCCALNREYLSELEVCLIKQHNSMQCGYNMTCGGESVSDETRAKLSAIFKGRKITWYDKILASRRANPNGYAKRGDVKGAGSPLSKSYLIRQPDGSEVTVKGLRAFCRERGLDHATLMATLSGKQTHHKRHSLLARLNDYPERE